MFYNTALVIFEKYFTFFPHTHSTRSMYAYLSYPIQYHLTSEVTPNPGLSSKMPLARLMAATFILHPLHRNVPFIETARVSSHKIVYLAVPSSSSLYTLCQGGRRLQLTRESTKMPARKILISLRENIILQTPDFQHVNNSSSPP